MSVCVIVMEEFGLFHCLRTEAYCTGTDRGTVDYLWRHLPLFVENEVLQNKAVQPKTVVLANIGGPG